MNGTQRCEEKGPRIGQNWFYHEAGARLKPRFLFSLENEGKQRFTDSNPHLNLQVSSFKRLPRRVRSNIPNCSRLYGKTDRTVYYDIYAGNRCFLSFFGRLSAQAALCNWPQDQEREF